MAVAINATMEERLKRDLRRNIEICLLASYFSTK